MSDPLRSLTAAYELEAGRRQQQRAYTPEFIRQTIISLRGLTNSAFRAQQILACAKRALDNADVIALAVAEIVATLPEDTQERRDLLAQLPTPTIAIDQPKNIPLAEQPAEPTHTVLVDSELMRVLVALGYGAQTLVYAVAQEMIRRADGDGKVSESALLDKLKSLGIEATRKTIRDRWLKEGNGVLWDWHKPSKMLYLYSPQRMTKRGLRGRLDAVTMALAAGRRELVETNPPGTRMIYVPIAATLKGWCGQLLAAWHNSRADHTSNISRFTLGILWGVKSKKTLISWERAAGIKRDACYAQYTDSEHIPAKHAHPYLAQVTTAEGETVCEVRAMAQHSNVYNAPSMKEHQHRMNPRARRRASLFLLENAASSDIPNGVCGATAESSGVGFKPTGRRNFFSNEDDLPKAFKRLQSHLRRDPDDNTAHFVRLGFDKRHNRWVYEQSIDGYQRTDLHEQLPRFEADAVFAAHGGRGSIVAAWRSAS